MTPDGAASYSVAIKVPAGVGGVEPRLSMTYNSRGGPSAFGVGWALTGYSVIQRGPRNLRDDGVVRGVQLDRHDALFLDGEKLVLLAQAGSTAEYRTRVETYSRIRAQLDADGQPIMFTVETKSGGVMRFGTTANSRSILPQGAATTWLMDEVSDRSGNYMSLRYLHDGLDYHLAEVLYGSNRRRGTPFTGKVSIDYVQVETYASRYVLGARVDQRMRAKNLTVSSLLPEGTVPFRRYDFKQGSTGEADKRKVTQLQQIVEHGTGGKEPLYFRPTQFNYSVAEPRWQPSDLLDGVPDLPDGPSTAGHFRLLRIGAPSDGIVPPAVAIQSLVAGKQVAATLRLNTSTGRWTMSNEFRLPVTLGGVAGLDRTVAVADVDGDGRDDVLASGSATNAGATHLSAEAGWTAPGGAPPFPIERGSLEQSGVTAIEVVLAGNVKKRVFLWQSAQGPRASYFDAGSWRDMPSLKSPIASGGGSFSQNHFAIDVDCDGRKELVILHGGTVRVFRHDLQKGWAEEPDVRFKLPVSVLRQYQGLRFADLNGDACADVLSSFRGGGTVRRTALIASPTGWREDSRSLPAIPFWDADGQAAVGELVAAPDGVLSISSNADTSEGAYRLETGGWERDDLYLLPDRLSSRFGERRLSFGVVEVDKKRTPQLVYLPGVGDGSRLPRLAIFNRLRGWEFDRQYSVPVDISIFDKIDLGVRFTDVNGDGHPDLIWSRKRSDGGLDSAAYIFQPTGTVAWARDDRYVLPTALVNEDMTPTGVQMIDVNGDGLSDLVTAVSRKLPNGTVEVQRRSWINCARVSGACGPNATTFWIESAEFRMPDGIVFYEDGKGATGVRMLDLNGDGLTDVLRAFSEERWGKDGSGNPVFEGYQVVSTAWLNSGNGWVPAPQFVLPVGIIRPLVVAGSVPDPQSVGGDQASQVAGVTTRENRVEFVDLDGDRLPDVIFNFVSFEKQLKDGALQMARREVVGALKNTGVGWTTFSSYSPPLRLDDEPARPLRQVQFEDINADGYVDMVVSEGTAGRSLTYLNTGAGWSEDSRFRIPDKAIRPDIGDQGFRLFDVNGDSLPDVVYAWTDGGQQEKRGVFLNTGAGFVEGKPEYAPPILFAEQWRGDTGIRPADLNGDAIVDLVQSFRKEGGANRKVFLNLSGKTDLLVDVTNGMLERTRVVYETFLASDRATSDPSPRIGPGQTTVSAYPILAVPLPGYVVRSHTSGAPGVASRTSAYRYDGYRIDALSGRALGFQIFEATDVDRQSTVLTEYLQEDGLVGNISSSKITLGQRVIGQLRNTWTVSTRDGAPSPFLGGRQSKILTRELAATVSHKFDLLGHQISKQEDKFAYDALGSATEVRTTFGDGSGSHTRSTYQHDTGRWLLGRLSRVTVTLTDPPKAPQVRTATYQYATDTGQLIAETELAGTPFEVQKRYVRDDFGNIVSTTASPVDGTPARSLTSTYDASGRFLQSSVNSLGHAESASFDPSSGVVLERRDANGVKLSYAYDAFQRVVGEASPSGAVAVQTIDFADPASGDLVMVLKRQTAGMSPSTTHFDGAGRVRRATNVLPDGRVAVIRTEYDRYGRISEQTLPFVVGATQHSRRFTYDELDRIATEVKPDGAKVTFNYDGLTVRTRNANGQESSLKRDVRGRTVLTVDALGGKTTFEYDVAGRLLKTSNAIGEVSSQYYDGGGRRTEARQGPSGVWIYRYNGFAELIEQVDPRGRKTRQSYDLLGRLTTRATNEGEAKWEWDTAANGVGKLARATLGNTSRQVRYDPLGRIVEETRVNGTDQVVTAYAYDEWNRPVSKAHSTGVEIRNAYNKHGFVDAVSLSVDGNLPQVVWRLGAADSSGRIREEQVGDNIRNAWTFDEVSNRLVRWNTQSGSSVIADVSIVTDRVGNVTRVKDALSGDEEHLTYDALNRLTEVRGGGRGPATTSYDALGNILKKSGVGTYNYCSGPGGARILCSIQLEDGTLRQLGSDAAGNLVADGSLRLKFDERGLVVSVENDAGNGPRFNYSRFDYDADNTLVSQETRVETTKFSVKFLGDVEITREEFSEPYLPTPERTRVRHYLPTPGGTIGYFEKTYLHFPYSVTATSRPFTMWERPLRTTSVGSSLAFFVRDHLGSVRALLSATGAVLERFSYDAWGRRLALDAHGRPSRYTSLRRGFTAHEHLDHFGLVHMGGRLYNATVGRFMSPDIVVQAPEFSQSHNRYAYAFNNPLRFTDPSGFLFEGIPILGDAERAVKRLANAAKNFYDSTLGKVHNWVFDQLQKAGKWLEQNWRVVVVIAVAVALGPAAIAAYGPIMGGALVGAVTGGLGAALHGGNLSDVLQGAAIGGFLGMWGGGMSQGIIASTSAGAGRAALLGGVTGVKSMMQGGRFESAFIASVVSYYADPEIEKLDNSDLRVAASAASGGVGAQLGGENFENGALNAAFGRMFKETIHQPAPTQTSNRGVVTDLFGKIWNAPNTLIGLVYGFGASLLTWTKPDFDFSNNAINFHKTWGMGSAMTLGNVITYGGATPDSHNAFGYETSVEEHFHTLQGQVLGPLYFPAHIAAGIWSLLTSPKGSFDHRWHENSWMESGPGNAKPF